ncbi:M domain protein [Desulfosporosinus nitroreducens]|uniref:M domain protein n=1 Tax=Desulfosporosinus nitroreducens TaxID=2018668 RepID=UPI00207D4AEB|nr:M domain protein [Desulfosporosinus nitroreducens]MCO1603179.1 M domain protein [Desulfosporosinus nitroreducens]
MEIEIKEMFRLILNKLNGLESKMDKLESKMELRMDNLESKMELRMDNLESKMELRMDNLESRQDEIYMVVKAIEHNNQVHRAELDNLKYTVTNVEGTINTIGDVITKRKAI